MQNLAGYILTPLYYLVFGLLLLIFHPVQVIAWNFLGETAHRKSVAVLIRLIIKSFSILGVRFKYHGLEKLPGNRPLIVVANHQSLFDIPAFIYGFNRYHPKFVSKVELARNIPSISYNLRRSGSALIDRSSGGQSIREILRVGQLIEKNNSAVCIYPEGTRSRDGRVRKFHSAGIKSLLRAAPSALIIPFVIDGHSEMMKKGYFPLQFGVRLNYRVLNPIDPASKSIEEVVDECEMLIKKELNQ